MVSGKGKDVKRRLSSANARYLLVPTLLLTCLIPFQNCAEVSFEQDSASLQSSLEVGPEDDHIPVVPEIVATPTPKPVTPVPTPTPKPPSGPFAWKTGAYGACGAACGKGLQFRNVECRDESTNLQVAETYCAGIAKPAAQLACQVANPSCKTWIRSAADFINLKAGPGEYACVEDDIDFKGAVVDGRFATNLSNQTVDGCGHTLKNLAFRTRGLFGAITSTTIRRLTVVDADVNVTASPSFSEAAHFGTIANTIAESSLVEDVEVRTSRKFQVKMNGFATWCAGIVGIASGGTFRRIKFQAGEVDLQCYFAGGFAGRIFPVNSSVKASEIGLSWTRLSYLGSGHSVSGVGMVDGVFGGFVGRFFGYHPATDELRSIQVHGNVQITGVAGSVGGVIGQIFQTVIEHPPLLQSLSYTGTIERRQSFSCVGQNPGVGGLLGHFFPKTGTNVPVVIRQSSFTGTLRIHECDPPIGHSALTAQGFKMNAGLGIGSARDHEDMIQLKDFNSVGNVLVEVPGRGVTTTSSVPRYPVIWKVGP